MNCETPSNCRIQYSAGMTTMMYYPPIYDGFGNNTNPDMNTTTRHGECHTCKRKWAEHYQNGVTTYKEVTS